MAEDVAPDDVIRDTGSFDTAMEQQNAEAELALSPVADAAGYFASGREDSTGTFVNGREGGADRAGGLRETGMEEDGASIRADAGDAASIADIDGDVPVEGVGPEGEAGERSAPPSCLSCAFCIRHVPACLSRAFCIRDVPNADILPPHACQTNKPLRPPHTKRKNLSNLMQPHAQSMSAGTGSLTRLIQCWTLRTRFPRTRLPCTRRSRRRGSWRHSRLKMLSRSGTPMRRTCRFEPCAPVLDFIVIRNSPMSGMTGSIVVLDQVVV